MKDVFIVKDEKSDQYQEIKTSVLKLL